MISLWPFAIVGSRFRNAGLIVAIGMMIAMIAGASDGGLRAAPADAAIEPAAAAFGIGVRAAVDDPPIDPAAIAFATALLQAPDGAARMAMLDARAADVTPELRRAIAKLGDGLRDRGEIEASLVASEIEQAITQRLGDRAAFVRAGWMLAQSASMLGDYDRALAVLRDGVTIARTLGDTTLERRTLTNEAIVHRLRGDLDEALAIQQQLLAAYERGDDSRVIARALNNIGILQEERGDYRASLASLQRSLTMVPAASGDASQRLHNIANVYVAQGEFDLARTYYQRALDVPSLTAMARFDSTVRLADTLRQLRQFDAALRHVTDARTSAETSHAQPRIAEALRIEALIHADRGDRAAAVPLLERSVEIGRASHDTEVAGYGLVSLAKVRRQLGEPEAALSLAREAIALGESQPLRVLAMAYDEAGEAALAVHRHEEARTALQSAIDLTEQLRDRVAGGEVEREQFFEERLAPYQAMMRLLLDEGAESEAFRYVERARARALLDIVSSGHVNLSRALTPAERDQERVFERRLQAAQRQLARASQPPAAIAATAPASTTATTTTVAQRQRELDATRGDLMALRTQLYAAHPELPLARGVADIPTVASLGALVPDASTALLAYASDGSHLWLFIIARAAADTGAPTTGTAAATGAAAAHAAVATGTAAATGAGAATAAAAPGSAVATGAAASPVLTVHRLAIEPNALAARVRSFRDALARRSLTFSEDARALYADLLQPAAAELRGRRRLVIVPDGVLWDVPFHALQPAPGHYLLERASVDYAPSLTFLYAARQHAAREHAAPQHGARQHPSASAGARVDRSAATRRELFALGNPSFGPAGDAATPVPLPESDREIRALAALYGQRRTTMITGAAATESRVKADAGRYRVLHLATHGVLDDRDPMYSAVLLAAERASADPAAAAAAEDGRLEAREVMNLSLNADLVVLSACDTARGRIGAGEGLLGLSWAILLAGSRDVVVSQWKVDATSTSQLMIAFHRALVHRRAATPPDVGQALKIAAREIMRDPRYRHPFYWAAFRTVGLGY